MAHYGAFLALVTVFAPMVASLLALCAYGMCRFRENGRGASFCHDIVPLFICVMLAFSAVAGVLLFILFHQDSTAVHHVPLWRWFRSADLDVLWRLRIDGLSVAMLAMVSFIATLIHIYALRYMDEDKTRLRFFAYMALFTFAMQMLVSADNMLQLFFGWEGVGLCSYLLIGYDYHRQKANQAAIKAFVVNRLGDWSFLLGIVLFAVSYGSVDIDALSSLSTGDSDTLFVWQGYGIDPLTIGALLLFIGAMAKSAQWGLHVWLADAMEGPTPVSALIHAATMVTAGIFMVARLSPVFVQSPLVLDVMVVVGSVTALLASAAAVTQYDMKRVIAWSTCSQLGYMVVALGLTAWGAAMFHLITHAFFKALLFLGAGSVIHHMRHEQDMRKMGHLGGEMPLTCVMMWIGCCALTGIPFLSGFYSKEYIIEIGWGGHGDIAEMAFLCCLCAAMLTAFYATRMMMMTFHSPHASTKVGDSGMSPPHDAHPVMLVPMAVLALFALILGAVGKAWFVGEQASVFWRGALFDNHEQIGQRAEQAPHAWLMMPVVLSIAMMSLAVLFYGFLPRFMAFLQRMPVASWCHSLLTQGWGMDKLYDVAVVRVVRAWAYECMTTVERDIIDAFGPDGVAVRVRHMARWVALSHSGRLYIYAFVMVGGVLSFLLWLGAEWSLFSFAP
ncbi:MAG: NADH-quinone oxidoreductase subunit L [Alphaproteobacteria bacterium GM7ARS4]|nr:NADH-quinone oxidoreductase subunit L [Alphaproteobacteria bacterium GM7ARS4]